MATNNNQVSVTNSTTSPVAILDAYDPSSTPNTPQSNQVYALPMMLRSTSNGAQTIAPSASAEVELDATRIIYDLVFARPVDLFPIQNSAVMQNIISGVYPPLTINSTSSDQLILALSFYINILTYPTSVVATNYYAAVSGAANNGASATDIDSAVTAFFQTTSNYKTLNLNSVVTAQTYARSFAFVWAGFTTNFGSFSNTITYYLYSPGTAASGTNNAAPVTQGTLSLTKSATPPIPADPADRTGAYLITYTSPNGGTTTLQFAGGQFVSDSSDFPAVALRGTFVLKSSLTNNSTDNVIVPILSGMVNGIQVMGTTTQQSSSGGGSSDFWAFFHPTTFGQYLGLITTLLGLAMGAEWILSKAKAAYNRFNEAAKPLTAEEIRQMREQLNELSEDVRAGQQRALDQLGDRSAEVPNEGGMPAAQEAGRADVVDANNVARGDAQLDVFEAQAAQVEVVAEYGVNPQLEAIAENIRGGAQNLEAAMPPAGGGGDALQRGVDEAASNIEANAPELSEVIQNVESELSASDAAEIQSSKAAQAEAEQIAEDNEKAADDAGEGEGGEGDDSIDGGAIEA